MTVAYANNTTVSVAKTKAEIEDLVTKYGATMFAVMNQDNQAMIAFSLKASTGEALMIRMRLNLPLIEGFAKHKHRGYPTTSTPERKMADWEQACRSLWRSMLLVVKAKLEACRAGISTVEREFLADVVTPSGLTVGEMAIPQLPKMTENGPVRLMLTGSVA